MLRPMHASRLQDPTTRAGRLAISVLLYAAWSASCAAPPPVRTTPPAARARVVPTETRPALYAADEAMRDVLSGQLEYVGTGPWPGNSRTQACVFRNDRVLVVNAYCTPTEMPAARVDVYSPTRGRVRVYAETKGAVSTRNRADYFTFTAESEPPPSRTGGLPPLSLAMSFDQLRAYDERRYHSYLPACYGGKELSKERAGCLGPLAPYKNEWTSRNRMFLERANPDWYRVVRGLHDLSKRYGKEPQ